MVNKLDRSLHYCNLAVYLLLIMYVEGNNQTVMIKVLTSKMYPTFSSDIFTPYVIRVIIGITNFTMEIKAIYKFQLKIRMNYH